MLEVLIDIFTSKGGAYIPLTTLAGELESYFDLLEDLDFSRVGNVAAFKRGILQKVMAINGLDAGIWWKDEEVEILVAMFTDGQSDEEIAARLGRTTAAITVQRNKLHLSNQPRWTTENETLLRELVEQGLSNLQIAIQLGKSSKAVAGKKIALGLTEADTVSDETLAGVHDLFLQGLADAEIANALTVTPETVRYVRMKYRLLREEPAEDWSMLDDLVLRDLFEEGKMDKDIAPILGRSVDAVLHRRAKLGLRRFEKSIITQDHINRVRELHALGWTNNKIRLAVGLNWKTVEKIINSFTTES